MEQRWNSSSPYSPRSAPSEETSIHTISLQNIEPGGQEEANVDDKRENSKREADADESTDPNLRHVDLEPNMTHAPGPHSDVEADPDIATVVPPQVSGTVEGKGQGVTAEELVDGLLLGYALEMQASKTYTSVRLVICSA